MTALHLSSSALRPRASWSRRRDAVAARGCGQRGPGHCSLCGPRVACPWRVHDATEDRSSDVCITETWTIVGERHPMFWTKPK